MPTERQRRRRHKLRRRADAARPPGAPAPGHIVDAVRAAVAHAIDEEIAEEHAALAAYSAAAPPTPARRAPRGEWLTIAEAAALLGVARSTLYRRARAGMLTLEQSPYTQGWMVSRTELRRMRRRAPNPGGRPPALPDQVRRRIRALRAQGMSLAAIADQLNVEAVPTAQGGTRWWASTVRAVLGAPR